MPAARDANWVDGLRGTASLMIVCGHLCTAFVPWLHRPAMAEDEGPWIFQLPLLRLCVSGRAAVAIFFLITGYVNSLGPISKSRSGNTDGAFASIARSALARSGKLVLPTIFATFVSWFLAQTNAYKMAQHIDATWIRQGYHRQEPTVWLAIVHLFRAQIATWIGDWNEYDGTQWTLHLFLEGAMMVYLTMLASVLVTPRARKYIYGALYVYAWLAGNNHEATIKSLNIIAGMFVAELNVELGSSATETLPTPVPSFLILLGFFMSGYPQECAEWMPWSNTMRVIMEPIIPEHADLRRYWDHLGAATILMGVFFSRNARRLLTSPVFNFLGRVSFPVYLLHNQLMKSVLVWMIYTPSWLNPPKNDKGELMDLQRASLPHCLVAIAVFYYILYRLALAWTVYIDPICAKIVKWATSKAYGDGQEGNWEKAILG
ncbi:acyltransferase 3 [Lineolata rhizophorae]|uniref:Acyltransferase 3 n=1 Tax=Lineolata rhizophorae TaxID=578093 RepID=A0A6A6P1A5_9PEZI|nr:acyltransferase 3 [Lineolata rhizophorae]